MSEAYKNAGVDVEAGYRSVELIKEHVKRTNIPGVLSGIGGFGGLFELGGEYKNPVLVSGTDGVGTKLKLAFIMDKHDTVGQDCVAMCVNDIVCGGAKPLFFLDYIAVGKNIPEKIADIVKGVSDGCIAAGCALVGGETAEMPGFYDPSEYDLAGFSVGIVDKEKIIDGENIKPGDVIIGIQSSGVHSNGYSLIRKVFNIDDSSECAEALKAYDAELGCSVGEALLAPTKIYVKPMLAAIDAVDVKAVSHITGGGFYENIPRMLKDGTRAKVYKEKFEVLPIFKKIQEMGGISEHDMYNTYNMGVGMMFVVPESQVEEAVNAVNIAGEKAFVIGEITEGEKGVDIC